MSPCNTCLAWVFDSTCLWLIPILPGWQITRHFAPVSLIELKIAQAKLHVFPSVKWWRCNIFVLKCIKTHIFQFFLNLGKFYLINRCIELFRRDLWGFLHDFRCQYWVTWLRAILVFQTLICSWRSCWDKMSETYGKLSYDVTLKYSSSCLETWLLFMYNCWLEQLLNSSFSQVDLLSVVRFAVWQVTSPSC